MDNREIRSRLIIIEQAKLTVYHLDDKVSWEIGRASREGSPDIELVTPTISRPHGNFKNKGGLWLYSDYCKLNGTTHNGILLTPNNNHKLLEDGDVLIFGGHGNAVINSQTVWAIYLNRQMDDACCVVNTSKDKVLRFTDGSTVTKFVRPEKGTVVDKGMGLGIYMGELTYLLGNIRLK